jgi:hypothetical protein
VIYAGHAAVSRNPETGWWVIVICAWHAGIWRYEEP